ncbi:MAG TPA: hypothetical protein VLT59_16030 [Steroidobacteraceae bacterium]|nr:hypothetical protein [Steroidobacteraceae bacterium]
MLTTQELLTLAAQPARGKRPQFVTDPVVDRLLSMTLGLVTELAVARERIDTLERVLERRGLLDRNEIEGYKPDDVAADERGKLQEQYLAQVFRALLQDDGLPFRRDLAPVDMRAEAGTPRAGHERGGVSVTAAAQVAAGT